MDTQISQEIAEAMVDLVRSAKDVSNAELVAKLVKTNGRAYASLILFRIAEMVRFGSFPDGITFEDIGRVLYRVSLVGGTPAGDALASIVDGYRKQERKV